MEKPGAKLFNLSEEHGSVDVTKSERELRVGDVVTVIPNHECTCVNMHDETVLVRGDQV